VGNTGSCKYCANKFQVSREWQLFCSSTCRMRYNRENNHCFYCGQRANARDHVEPVAERAGGRYFEGLEFVRVCTECNSWLGNKTFDSVADRVGYIAYMLAEKYKLNRRPVVWRAWELEEMGHSLKTRIKQDIAKWAKRKERHEYALAVREILERAEEPASPVKAEGDV